MQGTSKKERWDKRTRCFVNNPVVNRYLKDIEQLSKSYNLVLSHEDSQGAFLVCRRNKVLAEKLLEAHIYNVSNKSHTLKAEAKPTAVYFDLETQIHDAPSKKYTPNTDSKYAEIDLNDDGPGEEDGPWAAGWEGRCNGTAYDTIKVTSVATPRVDTPDIDWKEAARKEHLSAIEWAGRYQEAVNELDLVTSRLATAVQMLADWCDAIRDNGTGWDDWDEYYKDAAYRPCDIRELIDAARSPEKDE